ncbi:gliding motility-associated C-terminal domain-containing protein, partial [Flavobacteriaceae bacterium]|nr:gliding motility-associated C-terminal domain-containing protein [Flavobacteriaceae bacterium]
ASINDIQVNDDIIVWYDEAQGGDVLNSDYQFTSTTTIYAAVFSDGCQSITRTPVTVEIVSLPTPISLENEIKFCIEQNATVSDLKIESTGYVLDWYDASEEGLLIPNDTPLESGVTYYASFYDPNSGCSSEVRLALTPIIVNCEVKIYNALSLNNDGKNDYMVIENVQYYPINRLEVFNRDGQRVFATINYGTNGNFFYGRANVTGVIGSNNNLPTGSYLYVFSYFNPFDQGVGANVVLKGFLTINSN